MTSSTILRRYSADEKTRVMGTPLSTAELAQIPLFASVSRKMLEDNQGAVARRVFQKGEVICRQGDYGSTAFYVLSGSCDVFITTAMSHVENEPRSGFLGFVEKMASLLQPPGRQKHIRTRPNHVAIDAPVDLPGADLYATIGPESLFGEMTCLNFYPRSATVVAREEVVVLEMLRNILDLLYKSEPQAKWRKQKIAAVAKGQPFDTPRPPDGP